MSKTTTCSFCKADCQKRQILCPKCWDGLADKRKQIIRRSTYRRDEVGKKFLVDLLTCDLNVIAQMLADANGKVLEPTSKFSKGKPVPQDTFTEVVDEAV